MPDDKATEEPWWVHQMHTVNKTYWPTAKVEPPETTLVVETAAIPASLWRRKWTNMYADGEKVQVKLKGYWPLKQYEPMMMRMMVAGATLPYADNH